MFSRVAPSLRLMLCLGWLGATGVSLALIAGLGVGFIASGGPASAGPVTAASFAALQDAFRTATNDETIELSANISDSGNANNGLAFPAGDSVTLDLNGQSLQISDVNAGHAAISVPAGSSLTIEDTGTAGSGSLSATGGGGSAGGAGIGGSGGGYQANGGTAGTVNVRGGTVSATGGGGSSGGAGIGGGAGGNYANGGIGGTVNVSGGTVSATGAAGNGGSSDGGAGIGGGGGGGGGYGGAGGTVNISGGTVSATGGGGAGAGAGIGGGSSSGGYGGAGGTVNISGGTVSATGGEAYGDGGAGIGGGGGYYAHGGTGGTVTVTGGTVSTTGIGGGGGYHANGGVGGTVTVGSMGSVTVSGGPDASGGTGGVGSAGSAGSLSNAGTLTLSSGAAEVVPSGTTVTNLATGRIYLSGSLSGSGTIDNQGVILVSSPGSIADTLHGSSLTVDTNAYELSLNAGSGAPSGSGTGPLYVYASTVQASNQALPSPTPPSGDRFYGWFTAASGGTQVSDTTPLSTFGAGPVAMTLYAEYQSPQAITFNPPATGTVGASTTLSATATSGLAVSFSPDSRSGKGVCAISGTNGATLTYDSAGSCVIDANQAGDATYSAAPQVTITITVDRTPIPTPTPPIPTPPTPTPPTPTPPPPTPTPPTPTPPTPIPTPPTPIPTPPTPIPTPLAPAAPASQAPAAPAAPAPQAAAAPAPQLAAAQAPQPAAAQAPHFVRHPVSGHPNPVVPFTKGPGQKARAGLIQAIPPITEIVFSPKQLVENASLALLLLLLVGFPAALVNGTLEKHHDALIASTRRVRMWMERMTTPLEKLPTGGILAVFVAVAAFLYSLADPTFGFNRASLAELLGLAGALLVVTSTQELVRGVYLDRRYHKRGRLKAFPMGLVAAIIMVLFSRASHFEPGYVFGILAGLSFKVEPTQKEEGRSVAIASAWLLCVAVAAWLVWVPVEEAVVGGNTAFALLVLDALLSTIWVCGVQSLLFDLIPLRFLDGERVFAWSRTGWCALYGFGMFIFVQMIMHPQTDRYGGNVHATLFSMLILFLAFTAVAIAFWGYFRLRSETEPKEDPRNLGLPESPAVPAPDSSTPGGAASR